MFKYLLILVVLFEYCISCELYGQNAFIENLANSHVVTGHIQNLNDSVGDFIIDGRIKSDLVDDTIQVKINDCSSLIGDVVEDQRYAIAFSNDFEGEVVKEINDNGFVIMDSDSVFGYINYPPVLGVWIIPDPNKPDSMIHVHLNYDIQGMGVDDFIQAVQNTTDIKMKHFSTREPSVKFRVKMERGHFVVTLDGLSFNIKGIKRSRAVQKVN